LNTISIPDFTPHPPQGGANLMKNLKVPLGGFRGEKLKAETRDFV